jgi:hypothetical protein
MASSEWWVGVLLRCLRLGLFPRRSLPGSGSFPVQYMRVDSVDGVGVRSGPVPGELQVLLTKS